jgi:hypothetical protein
VNETEPLGMEIGKGWVGISPKKVEAITKEWPLTSKKGVQQFLGMANYH